MPSSWWGPLRIAGRAGLGLAMSGRPSAPPARFHHPLCTGAVGGAEAELPFCRPLHCQLPFLKEFGAYSSNMAFDPLSLTYHEAGHAIVARHFGCELIDIFISLDDQCGGATVTVCGLNEWQKGLIALAGCAAEVLAGYAVADDPDRAWEYVKDASDAQQAVGEITGLDIGDDGFRNAYEALEAEAEKLLRRPPIW